MTLMIGPLKLERLVAFEDRSLLYSLSVVSGSQLFTSIVVRPQSLWPTTSNLTQYDRHMKLQLSLRWHAIRAIMLSLGDLVLGENQTRRHHILLGSCPPPGRLATSLGSCKARLYKRNTQSTFSPPFNSIPRPLS